MLALGFTVVAISAVAWFVHRVIKADKDLVSGRQAREMTFLAQTMQRVQPSQPLQGTAPRTPTHG